MLTRRQFVCRSTGLVLAGTGALGMDVLSQERTPAGSLSRGMITPEAQRAIDAGLAYLAKSQNADGTFGTDRHRGNIAITSLCGLAFLAGGHQPGRGRYGNIVTRTLRFLLNKEHPGTRGYLYNPASHSHGPMYGHGFGTLFLAEVYGMVYDPQLRQRLRTLLRSAVSLIIQSQNHQGGWRYSPNQADADISVTICQIMALRAARNAGIYVPKQVAERCIRYVESCHSKWSGGFLYKPGVGSPGFARTAAGIVALYSADVYEGEAIDKGLQYLERQCMPGKNRNQFTQHAREINFHYYYGHYYAAQAMWIAGGRYWRRWFPAIRDELLTDRQRRRNDGSWGDRRWGTHYATAMACIILQVPNNYLPIFQR